MKNVATLITVSAVEGGPQTVLSSVRRRTVQRVRNEGSSNQLAVNGHNIKHHFLFNFKINKFSL
jgi:hypothetical protein